MAKIPKGMGHGEGGDRVAQLELILNELVDDLTELRSKYISLLQKLDADTGVADTNYAATLTPAQLKTQRSDT